LVALLGACASTPKPTFSTEHQDYTLTSASKLDDRQKADLFEALIAADLAAFKGDSLTAMSYYLYAAELSKEPQVIRQSINAAKDAEDPLGLEQAAKIWLTVAPDNIEAQTIFLEAQFGLGNLEPIVDTAERIINGIKDMEERYSFIVQNILGNEPRLSFSVLRQLKDRETSIVEQLPIITAQAKFIFDLSSANKSPSTVLGQSLGAVEKALTIDKHFIPAVKLKSLILFQLHRDAEAVAYLSSLYSQMPNSARIALMLGQLYYDLRNYNASANHFTGWLKDYPNDLEARYYQAASYYALGQYHLSLENFKRLLGKNHAPHTVAFYCGDSAAKTKDYKQAELCFKQVTEGRFYISAKIQLAKLYAEQGDLDKGLSFLKQVETSEVDKIKLVNAEVNLLDKFGTRVAAQKRLEEALSNYPDDLSLLIKKIRLYELTKHPEKLYELLSQAKSLMDSNDRKHEFILVAARILRDNKHHQLAINWLNEALKDSPDNKELLYTRALYKESLELYDEMISDFKHLLSLFPEDLNIKNALGYTLADTGKELDLAQQLIDDAYQGLPNNAAVIDSKGWIAFRKGQMEDAEKFLGRAFKMQPSAEGAAHLGEVFWITGKTEFAKRIWKEGLELDKENRVLRNTLKRLKVELEEK